MANATTEITWIESFLKESFISPPPSPVILCDNLSTTYLVVNPLLHTHTKHVEIDYHFVRERVAQNLLLVQFIPSEDQLADVMTKALLTQKFIPLRSKLIVLSHPMRLRGMLDQNKTHPYN